MCMTRTYIFEGVRIPDTLKHRFDLYDTYIGGAIDCSLDPRAQEDQCLWPIWEDIWSGRGGPEGRVHFRVVIVPAHWSEQEMRNSISWWGEPSEGQVVP